MSHWANISCYPLRQTIDQELKRVCEELIASCSDIATAPFRSSSPQTSDESAISQFRDVCEKEVKNWTAKVRLYLGDPRTVAILVAPLHGSIVREFEAFEQRRRAAGHSVSNLLNPADLWALLRDWSEENSGF